MLVKNDFAKATFKDVSKFKINWLYKLYLKYVELYDFSDLV